MVHLGEKKGKNLNLSLFLQCLTLGDVRHDESQAVYFEVKSKIDRGRRKKIIKDLLHFASWNDYASALLVEPR